MEKWRNTNDGEAIKEVTGYCRTRYVFRGNTGSTETVCKGKLEADVQLGPETERNLGEEMSVVNQCFQEPFDDVR